VEVEPFGRVLRDLGVFGLDGLAQLMQIKIWGSDRTRSAARCLCAHNLSSC
jgi:hypothetical protein